VNVHYLVPLYYSQIYFLLPAKIGKIFPPTLTTKFVFLGIKKNDLRNFNKTTYYTYSVPKKKDESIASLFIGGF
jgi:hypothetical protein